MNSRRKFIIAFLTLCFAVLFITSRVNPKTVRVQQHLTYNTDVKDTSLSIDQETFSSHLPVVSIDTGGAVIPGRPERGQRVEQIKNSFIHSNVKIWEKEGELNTLHQKADLEVQADIRVRGNSSRRFNKVGYLLKFVDSDGNDNDKVVMGMESSSSWILHGPFLDKTLMRNYMWYNLSGQIMEWAPDVRFCEVFLNGSYQGVYVMTEQISVGDGRIDIKKYDGKSEITSYVVCADRTSVNDVFYLNNSNFAHRY
ncbi:CotH kinase family protein [Blautia schinkii]|nr:CotH kinase family protein [Blautia schinkii]